MKYIYIYVCKFYFLIWLPDFMKKAFYWKMFVLLSVCKVTDSLAKVELKALMLSAVNSFMKIAISDFLEAVIIRKQFFLKTLKIG